MTEPVRPLEALIAEWRHVNNRGLYGRGMRRCADELAAFLQAAAPPAPTMIEIGSVEDWQRLEDFKRRILSEAPPAPPQDLLLKTIQDALVDAFYDPDPADPTPEVDYTQVDWVGVIQDARRRLDELRGTAPRLAPPERVSEGKDEPLRYGSEFFDGAGHIWPCGCSQHMGGDIDHCKRHKPAEEQTHVRILDQHHHLPQTPHDGAANRGMGEGSHEQNCPALIFDGDDRATINERRCLCRKRLAAVEPREEQP